MLDPRRDLDLESRPMIAELIYERLFVKKRPPVLSKMKYDQKYNVKSNSDKFKKHKMHKMHKTRRVIAYVLWVPKWLTANRKRKAFVWKTQE